jgi:hypothetical protein
LGIGRAFERVLQNDFGSEGSRRQAIWPSFDVGIILRLIDCSGQPELKTSINTVCVRVRKNRTTNAAATPPPYRD